MKSLRFAIRLAMHCVAGAMVLITVPWMIGVARAAAGDAPAVPPPTPDAIASYLAVHGPFVGVVTLAYVLVGYLLRLNASTHWVAQGKRLAWITAGVGVAGTALQAYTGGTPVSGVVVTAVLGLLHIADAQVTPPRSSQAGYSRIQVMLLLAGAGIALAATMGCGASQRETTIRSALIAADSARDGFLAYDRAHELGLTAHCDPAVETKDQCAAKVAASGAALASYQAQRAKLDPLFALVYRAIAAAWIADDDQSLASMQAALGQLIAGVKPFIAGGK